MNTYDARKRLVRSAAQGAALMQVARQVPHTLRDAECTDVAETDVCAWAQSADAVVLATVSGIRLADTPVAGPAQDAEWKWYGACSKIQPALRIELQVEHDVKGRLSGPVTVHVGKRQLDTFVPSPYRGRDGSLQWNMAEGEAGPLSAGQEVLAALHYVQGQKVWSLMGDMLSAVDPSGVVHAPRGGCLSRVPAELDRQQVTRAVDRLSACLASPLTAAALELRSKRRRAWGDELKNGSGAHPANYMAAECIEPDFEAPDPDVEDE